MVPASTSMNMPTIDPP